MTPSFWSIFFQCNFSLYFFNVVEGMEGHEGLDGKKFNGSNQHQSQPLNCLTKA
jgi:hypothetical protein